MLEMTYDPAPVRTAERTVPAEWIDYNGHMNVAYYTMAFDNALDEVYESLGIGENLVREHSMGPMALQSQLFYLGELLEGTRFACDFRLLDADPKRVHCFMQMLNLDEGGVAATYETLSLNVDLEVRRGTPYPAHAWERIEQLLAAQARLERPPQVGRTIGIRRTSA